MFRAGRVVADHVDPVSEVQVQPNGVDLTLADVLEPRGAGYIGRSEKAVGDRGSLTPETPTEAEPGRYYLPPGGYVVQYRETVSVPRGHVGFLFPRSTLLRNACSLNTAVWDAGYTGKGEGLLQVYGDLEIEEGARIGQFVLATAGEGGAYDGSYQGERTGE